MSGLKTSEESVLAWVLGGAKKVSWVCLRAHEMTWHDPKIIPKLSRLWDCLYPHGSSHIGSRTSAKQNRWQLYFHVCLRHSATYICLQLTRLDCLHDWHVYIKSLHAQICSVHLHPQTSGSFVPIKQKRNPADALCFDLSSGHHTWTCPVHLQCQEIRLSDKVHKISQGSSTSASHTSPKSRRYNFHNGLHRWQHRDRRRRTSRASRIQKTHIGELRIC